MRQGVIFFVVNEEVVNTSKCYLILHSVDWKVKCLSKKITSNFAVQMCLICYGQRLRYIHILLVFGIQRFQMAYINDMDLRKRYGILICFYIENFKLGYLLIASNVSWLGYVSWMM